jgi:hypothetical protein
MTWFANQGDKSDLLKNTDPVEAQAGGILDITTSAISDSPSVYTQNELGGTDGPSGTAILSIGSDSLFNPFYVFRYAKFASGASDVSAGTYDVTKHKLVYQGAILGADPLHEERRKTIENPTAKTIIDWTQKEAANGKDHTGPLYPAPYQYNDFLWCKYYGKIPNNRLLTLRRYPIPVEDNLAVAKENLPLIPIAQAVTWWGGDTGNNLSDILGMTYAFNWDKDAASKVQDVAGNEVEAGKVLDALGIKKDAETLRAALSAIFFQNPNNPFEASGYDKDLQNFTKESWETGAYWNRVLGPVNVIDKTMIRQRGYTFTHNINLDFEYTMRSYGTINPKVAMLDLLSNFLSLTYNRALFWGGSYRYFQKTGYIAIGLSNDKLEQGDAIGGLKDLLTQLGGMTLEKAEELKKFVDSLGSQFDNATDLDKTITEITTAAGKNPVLQDIVSSRLSGLYQKPLVLRSLLDGRAVGEWHLTVGNPMDPIAAIGNLCLQSTKMTFTEELGDSDFPIGVKFSVTLEPGRPRAKQDIESMFNMGGGDLGFTKIQDPASAFNSYGEYNSIRLSKALKTAVDSGIQASQDLARSAGVVAETAGATPISDYFKRSVQRAYGEGFANSGILPSYFQQLKTKD